MFSRFLEDENCRERLPEYSKSKKSSRRSSTCGNRSCSSGESKASILTDFSLIGQSLKGKNCPQTKEGVAFLNFVKRDAHRKCSRQALPCSATYQKSRSSGRRSLGDLTN